MGLEDRVKRLEVKEADATSEWVTPIEARVHMKAVARYHALEHGKEPPPYSREEIEAMRRWDLEIVEGRGVRAQLRDSAGWQSEEARELLASWEEGARRRLSAAHGLPPERWHEVWGVDEEDEELRLIRDALRRGLDEEEFPTELGVSLEEKAALERFSKLYEEERRGL